MPRPNGITRQEILFSIKCHGPMTADELARSMGISQVAVRQHLASLEAEGLIAVNVERRGLGRPSHRYQLTAQGDETFPRAYDAFASELLGDLQALHGDEALHSLLEYRRSRFKAALQPRLVDKPLPARVHELARAYNERGYMAEAREADPGAYLFVKRNCAVCSVARCHPQVCCQGECELIRELLGSVSIRHDRSILDGHHACTFHISENAKRHDATDRSEAS